jgi:hypothetical protein
LKPIFQLAKRAVLIDTGTCFRGIAFSCLVVLASMPVLCRAYFHFRADLMAEKKPTIAGYSRAIAYDPDNAKLWWVRGRLRHYGLGASDPEAAVRDYEHALSLNPRLGQAWLDLAACLERLENFQRSEECLNRAMEVLVYSPSARWQAGNYYLLRGDLKKMYEYFRAAIDLDNGKLDVALRTAWKADPDHSGILSMLVPDKMSTNLNSLSFFIANDDLVLAQSAWERFLRNGNRGGLSGNMPLIFRYIDALLAKDRIEDAFDVWLESLDKNLSRRMDQQTTVHSPNDPIVNLVWNGSFEEEILNGGFDWRIQETGEADIKIDAIEHADGFKSLKVTFNKTNADFFHISQLLPMSVAGDYQLQYFLKTQNLTTDQKPYFVIENFPPSQSPIFNSESFPSSSPWKKYSFTFRVKPGTKAVKLLLRRSPSEKFDSQIQGSFWLDNVEIRVDNLQSEKSKKSIDTPSGK